MKSLRWVAEHTAALPAESGVNFEHVVVAVEAVGLLDVENHLNPTKYPNHRVIVVAWDGCAYLVP